MNCSTDYKYKLKYEYYLTILIFNYPGEKQKHLLYNVIKIIGT